MTPEQRKEAISVLHLAIALDATVSIYIHPDTPSEEAALNALIRDWDTDRVISKQWTSRQTADQRVTVAVFQATEPDRPAGPPNGTTVKGNPRAWDVMA